MIRHLYFEYLDAAAEQHRAMKAASDFWHELMFEYDWNHQLNLPIDHSQNASRQHISSAYTFSLTFNEDLTQAIVDYASSTEISLSALLLTCYYVFLFKLTNNQTDLCIGTNTDSRYTSELKEVIGIFNNL